MNLLRTILLGSVVGVGAVTLAAQSPSQPDWTKVEEETMRHYQALLRFDTSDPPGNEEPAAQYLKQVLDAEGIPATLYSPEPHRVNLVARLKGRLEPDRRETGCAPPASRGQNRYIPATNTTPENSSVVTQYPMMSRTPSPAIASAGSAQNGCAMLVQASPYAIAIAALPRSAPSA